MFLRLLRPFLRLGHFKGKTRIENSLRKRLWGQEVLKVGEGLRMELDPQEWIQFQLIKGDSLEPKTLALFHRLLKTGDTFVDVGSHVGLQSLVGRQQVGESGLVIAIEPQPYNAAKVLTNWRENGFTNLRLYVAGAGERDGTVWLHDQDPSDRALLSLEHGSKRDLSLSYAVPVVSLATVFRENEVSRVRLLKVDVEGFEMAVMRGLQDRIEDIDHIIVECLEQDPYGKRSREVPDYLESRGFRLSDVDGNPWESGALPESNLWASRSPR